MGLIEIGQDALGGWAWMLVGNDGQLIECGSDLPAVEAAIDAAADAWAEAKIRGEPHMTARPHFVFPDGIRPPSGRR